jgi:alpha-1,2-mannosyltransferase
MDEALRGPAEAVERQEVPHKAGDRLAVKVGSTAGAAAFFLVTVYGFRHFFDLGVYRGAVRYWLHDGGNLYAFRYRGSGFGFTYPPFAALIFSPLGVLPWPVVVMVSVVVNSGAVLLLVRWFGVPLLRRHSWPLVTGCALTFCALLVFEPVQATFGLGQINLLLLVLVCFDQRILRGNRWAGIGIGIAAAIKLTPAVFIGYLLVSRKYRAALVATGTAVAVTLLSWIAASDPSSQFWTSSLWDTGRVGQLAALPNQSLRGVVARLGIATTWWLAAAVLVMAIWLVRVLRAARSDNADAAFALTGVVGCLISPVTWSHHLVWVLPALFVCLEAALAEPDPRRHRLRMGAVAVMYLVLCIKLPRMEWAGVVGSNAYVWICLALLATTPIRTSMRTAPCQSPRVQSQERTRPVESQGQKPPEPHSTPP